MEGLFNERLQVRTRHLQERVGALSKQFAAHKADNARLQKSHSDATHKARSLQTRLRIASDVQWGDLGDAGHGADPPNCGRQPIQSAAAPNVADQAHDVVIIC